MEEQAAAAGAAAAARVVFDPAAVEEDRIFDVAIGGAGGGGGGGGGAGGDSSAAEGDRSGRYCAMYGCALVRCASQSSLDETSQGQAGRAAAAAGAAGGTRHAGRLLAALARQRRAAELTDVRLLARPEPAASPGAPVPAHRSVLAAASPYFHAMFTQFEERTQPEVTIQGVEPAALEAIVEYVYEPASLVVTEANVQALLSAASLLQVEGARAAACAFLAAALAPDNALGIRAFAELHACADLAAAALAHIERRFVEVVAGEEFLALEPEGVARLLESDRVVVPGEEAVLDAVERWVRHAPGARAPHLPLLLEHVRLPLLRPEVLLARVAQPPLAGAEVAARVKDLVIEALAYHLVRGERRALAGSARARPRAGHAPPGALLVAGGQAPKAIRDVEVLRLASETWAVGAPLPSRRCRAGLAVVEGRAYAVGGFNGTLRVRTVDVYDVATGRWTPGPPLGARRSTLGVAVLAGTIYAVGGFDGATGLSSAEALDAAAGAGEWRPIAAMSTRRSSVGVAVLDGLLYAVGGYDGAARQCLATVERYDPATDSWSPVAEMAARRSGCGVGVAEGALYAVGGHDGPAVRRSVERYRPEGGRWSGAPAMQVARRNAGVAAHRGKLYVVGGDDGAANLDSVEVFDPATDAWTLLARGMAVARSYAGVAALDADDVPQGAPAGAGCD